MKNRILILVLSLLSFSCAGTRANPEKISCMNTLYQTRDYACVEKLINQMDSTRDLKELDALTNYMAAVFKHYPEFKQNALAKNVSKRTKALFTGDLHIAGLDQEARNYAIQNGMEEALNTYISKGVKTLSQMNPTNKPGDNDIMISAFLASGDTGYIKKILNNYKNLNSLELSDAIRFGLLTSKFGPTLAPQGRKSNTAVNLCMKYECKTNPNDFPRIVTTGTAYWALNSLAQKHESVRNTIENFYKQNPDIYKIIYKEQVNLSNYFVLFAVNSAIKNDNATNQLINDYENFKEFDFEKAKEIGKN